MLPWKRKSVKDTFRCANVRKVRNYEKFLYSFRNFVTFVISYIYGEGGIYNQKAVAITLEKNNIAFVEQYYTPVVFGGKTIGKYYVDFLIEERIILELKRGQFIPAQCIQQTLQYLKNLELQLGLIACFTYTGVYIKKIINHTIS